MSLRLVWGGAGKSSGSDTFGQVNSDTGSEIAHETPFIVPATQPDVVDFPDGTHAAYVDSYCSTDGSTNCYFAANTTPVILLQGMDTTLSESVPPTAAITGGSLAGAGPVSGPSGSSSRFATAHAPSRSCCKACAFAHADRGACFRRFFG